MNCPRCKAQIPPNSTSCPKCGVKFQKGIYCPHCHAVIAASSKVCPKCRKPVQQADTYKPQNGVKTKKPSTLSTVIATVVVVFLIFGIIGSCFGGNDEKESKTKEPPSSMPSEDSLYSAPQEMNENESVSNFSFNVDWDKCEESLKESVLDPEFFPYVRDLDVTVDNEKKRITFSAVVDDSTDPEVALDYADTLVRQYNLMANMQDNDIKLASKDYYGGLYDLYDVMIGVAPQSKIENSDQWFVFHAIIAGAHDTNKIKLQKAYIDG